MKNYPNYTEKYVLYEMSYANLIMYSSVLPSFDSSDSKNEYKDREKSAKKGLSFGEFLSKMKGLQK